MKKHLFCILVVLCLALNIAFASTEIEDGSISGVITSPDGAMLPGVIVTVSREGTGYRTQVVSNSSGAYRIPGLKSGEYELATDLIGFEPFRATKIRIEAGANRAVDITLQMATVRLIVTVVGFAPKDSMEASETRESSARDVGEAIAQTPGIFKLRKGGIANDIILRGFSAKDLNVLIDGQRIYGACPNHMDPAAFHVDFAEVDRIEVAKGPFDIKSQGSLGGVVNIVTRKAEKGFHAVGNLATGSYDFINPSAFASYGSRTFSVLGGYSYRASSPYADASGKRFTEGVNYRPGSQKSDAFRVGTLWGNVSFNPFAGHVAQISYSHQEADHVLYPYLQMDAVYDDTDRINMGYQVSDQPGFMKALHIQGYFTKVNHWMTDQYRTSSLNMLREYSMGTMARTEALGGRIESTLNTVMVGIEAYHRKWDGTTNMAGSGYSPQYSIPDVRTDSVGIYSEYARPLTEKLKLSFGGRLDTVTTATDPSKANTNLYFAYNATRRVSTTNSFPSGNARLSYTAPLGLQFSGGIGHTVRVPDARERYFALKRMGTDWVGNPDLKPAKNTGFDGGVTFRHQGLLLESNLYLNHVADYVAIVPKTRMNPVSGIMNTKARSYQNIDAKIYGAEFLVSYVLTPQLFVSGDLSFVRGTHDSDPSRGIFGSNLAEMPPVRSRTVLRYDTGRLFMEMEGILAGAQDNVDSILGEQRTAGYGIANFKGGIAFKRTSVKIGLNNLFDRKYYEHLSYMRDPFRSGARINEPGRNLFINISYRY